MVYTALVSALVLESSWLITWFSCLLSSRPSCLEQVSQKKNLQTRPAQPLAHQLCETEVLGNGRRGSSSIPELAQTKNSKDQGET